MSVKVIINRELHALKTLELKVWLKFMIVEFFLTKYLIESLMCFFVYLGV